MFMQRTAAALLASALGLAMATGCATSSDKRTAAQVKAAKLAKAKAQQPRYSRGADNDFSLYSDGDVDEKHLKRGQNAMATNALDSL